MKKLLFLLVFMVLGPYVSGQIERVRRISGSLNHEERQSLNSVIGYVNDHRDPMQFAETRQDIYISTKGNDRTGDGSSTNPFKTTERAVNSVMDFEFTTPTCYFHYDVGVYQMNDIIPHLNRLNDDGASTVYIIGTPVIGDTINVTHPGTATQSYFRFNTDSTITGNHEREFLGRLIYGVGAGLGYPIIEHTENSLKVCGDSYLPGTNRFFYTLGTKFQVNEFTQMRFDKATFYGIDFIQTDSMDSYSFQFSNRIIFNGCKFSADYENYDAVELEGVSITSFTHCIFEQKYNAVSSGDIAEVNLGDHVFLKCYFWTPNGLAMGGGGGIESRPGAQHCEVAMCAFKGFASAIKNDGFTSFSLGGTYVDSCTIAFNLWDPRRQFWGESDYNVWSAGYDSIICEDVDYLFSGNDVYDAGKSVFLPHLKAGGYGSFHQYAGFQNLTLDLGKLAEFVVGGGDNGFHYIKQPQLTGSLTDGTPTDSEIDAITGTTPSAVGAGWSVTILDSDGTGLLYRIESDGTNWQYQILTVAL